MGIQINGQTDSISATDGSLTVSGADFTGVSAGTTSAPSISPTGDSNTGIFFPSPDTIAFAEGGVEALRVTSSGDIGIGTATPSNYFSYDLVVKSRQNTGGITIAANSTSDTNYLMFADGTSGNAAYRGYINYVHSDDSLNIASAGSVRATLDSSGRFLLGATSARTDIPGGTQGLLIEGTSSTNTQNRFITHVYGGNDSQGPYLGLGKTRSTSLGGNTVVQSGDEFGGIYFHGSDGSTLRQGAYILASCDGTPGAADMPGRLIFATTADGASSPTERMTIKSNGEVIFDGNSASAGWSSPGTIHITSRNGSSALTTEGYGDAIGFAHAVKQSGSASGGNGWAFICYNSSNSVIGGIRTSTTATSFPTSSDYRLKENIVPLAGAIERINQLQVHRFNFIADPDKTVDGFIAHEAQTVVPEAVHGIKDEIDDDGNPIYQGIDQSKLVPLLTAALQEAIGEIEALKARVAALESA